MTSAVRNDMRAAGSPSAAQTVRGNGLARKAMHPAMLIVPAIVLLCIVYLLPLSQLMRLSTSESGTGGMEASGFTWSHYREFFEDPTSYRTFLRSLWIAAASTLVALLLAIPYAFTMARTSHNWLRQALVITALLPMTTSGVVRAYGLIMVLGDSGPVNQFLMWLGVVDAPVKILYGPWALVIGNAYFVLPFVIFPLTVGISKIDKRLTEAASTLGATPLRLQFNVVAPLLIPSIAAGSVVAFTLTMTAYVTPGLLGGHGYLVVTTLLGQQMFNLANWVSGAVISTILLLCVVAVVLVYQTWLDRKAQFYEA